MIARVGKKNASSGGSGFKYRKRSAEDVKKRADQTGGNFDSPVLRGFDMWRPKAGENVIRILPPTWEDFDHYGFDVFMHRFIGSDSSNYLCLNKMKGKTCPACLESKAAKDDGEDDEAKELAFQKRCWVWIIDRDDKSETPQVWDMSWSQDRDIAAMSHFKSGKILLIDHPDDGYDIIVKKTGVGKKTRYAFNIERDSSPISDDDDKQEEILSFIQENPIPTVLNFFSAEHIEKKLAGTTEDKDKDLDDDDKPKKKKRRDDDDEEEAPKKKRRTVTDDDDEEEETPRRRKKPADDDDEEEASPRKRRREPDDEEDDPPKKKRRTVEDEEDDPPKKKRRVADDDDEEETPKKRRRPADDDDEEDPPKKKRRPAEDEEEDDPPKKKRRPVEDEEEDDPPKKKKRPVEDDEEEDEPRRRRR